MAGVPPTLSAGFIGHGRIDWAVAVPFAVAGAVGASFRQRVAAQLDDQLLRRAFALGLVVLSAMIAWNNT